MAITILKNTNNETVVKVSGIGSETITLASLTATTQVATPGGTLAVNIVSANWTGFSGSSIDVVRGTDTVIPISAEGAQNLDFAGQGYVDLQNNTEDIDVTIAGADAALYLVLRKVSGWSTTVEMATYGIYDDPTIVGASTTMSGSPDKV